MILNFLPNLLTIIRLCLTLPIVWAIIGQQLVLAISLFTLAALSDGLDGYLARRFHWQSYLGSVLDPIADKVLLIAVFITLSTVQYCPVWLTSLVIGRDLLIVCGAALFRWRVGPYDFQPTLMGKVCTFFQLGLVLVVLVHQWLGLNFLLQTSLLLTAFFTIVSGLQYVLEWGGKWLEAYRRQ